MLLGLGLQHKTVEDLEKELDLPSSQLLGLFNRIIRKVVNVSLICFSWRNLELYLVKAFIVIYIYILRLSFYLYTVDIQIIFDDSAERIKKSQVT